MNQKKSGSRLSEDVFEYRAVEKRKFVISLIITFSAIILEFIDGFLTKKTALIIY
jgi:Co/Zn/Cd efflux system component